jgi:uncharacterized protein YecT (DUF1311 family)
MERILHIGDYDVMGGVYEHELDRKVEKFLERHPQLDSRLQKLYVRTLKHIERREKDHKRLSYCQSSWVGFKPKCCATRAIAIPVGCNHRLCFLCNGRRCEKFRDRVRLLFDRLTHPAILVLTIPNVPLGSLRKRVYSDFRTKWNKLRKRWAGFMLGGLFAFETTFNNDPDSPSYETWHVHAHSIIDWSAALPLCKCRGRQRDARTGKWRKLHVASCAFTTLKRRIEFDWLCVTQGNRGADRWRPSDFDYWYSRTIPANWRDESARTQWNRTNRRSVDIRRVTNRKEAAFEILKYVTKGSHFCALPKAINEFIDATKGARMLQTFGTWYGFDFDDDVNTWAHLKCGCGKNEFERIGVFDRFGVFMDEQGQWHPRDTLHSRCTGPPGQT